jgi:hypothetical protein
VEEEVARTVGAVRTQEECDYDDVKDVTQIQLLDIGDLSKGLIASATVTSIPRKASQVDAELQDVHQVNAAVALAKWQGTG